MTAQTRPDFSQHVCVGNFSGAHGVSGLVRVRSFTADPRSIADYGPVTDETGRQWRLTLTGMAPKGAKADVLVAKIAGVADRDQAQALNGLKLYVLRSALPPADDEDDFYQADLIGCLAVLAEGGDELGRVKAVHDFGAGDMLEINRRSGGTMLLPFTRACVPVVEIAARRLLVSLPIEVEARPDEDDADVGPVDGLPAGQTA